MAKAMLHEPTDTERAATGEHFRRHSRPSNCPYHWPYFLANRRQEEATMKSAKMLTQRNALEGYIQRKRRSHGPRTHRFSFTWRFHFFINSFSSNATSSNSSSS